MNAFLNYSLDMLYSPTILLALSPSPVFNVSMLSLSSPAALLLTYSLSYITFGCNGSCSGRVCVFVEKNSGKRNEGSGMDCGILGG